LGQFSKNYRTFYQKNLQKALKNPGVKKAPDPGSLIRNTAKNKKQKNEDDKFLGHNAASNIKRARFCTHIFLWKNWAR
jgi:hypothetical protein